MVIKIDDCKIEYQPNTNIYFFKPWEPYKKLNETNYETKFSINQYL